MWTASYSSDQSNELMFAETIYILTCPKKGMRWCYTNVSEEGNEMVLTERIILDILHYNHLVVILVKSGVLHNRIHSFFVSWWGRGHNFSPIRLKLTKFRFLFRIQKNQLQMPYHLVNHEKSNCDAYSDHTIIYSEESTT